MLVITNENFESEIINGTGITIVDFYADWCGPCKMMAPTMEEIDAEADGFCVAKCNTDDCMTISMSLKIASIPTIIVFKDGKIANRAIGVQDKEDILSMIETAKNA